jgi:hypothetical protein
MVLANPRFHVALLIDPPQAATMHGADFTTSH